MDVPPFPTGSDLRVIQSKVLDALTQIALDSTSTGIEKERHYLGTLSDGLANLNDVCFRLGLESTATLQMEPLPPSLIWRDEWRQRHSQNVVGVKFHAKVPEVLARASSELDAMERQLRDGKAVQAAYTEFRTLCVSAMEAVFNDFPIVRLRQLTEQIEAIARELQLRNPIKIRQDGNMPDGPYRLAFQNPGAMSGIGCDLNSDDDRARARGLTRKTLFRWIHSIDNQVVLMLSDRFGTRMLPVPPGELVLCDLNPIVKDMEAATRTRLADGQNPLWFLRVYDQYQKQHKDGVPFREYCKELYPGRIEDAAAFNLESEQTLERHDDDGYFSMPILCRIFNISDKKKKGAFKKSLTEWRQSLPAGSSEFQEVTDPFSHKTSYTYRLRDVHALAERYGG